MFVTVRGTGTRVAPVVPVEVKKEPSKRQAHPAPRKETKKKTEEEELREKILSSD